MKRLQPMKSFNPVKNILGRDVWSKNRDKFNMPSCWCGHTPIDHWQGLDDFSHINIYGACKVPDCGCKNYVPKNR
jgi:hypothetical protein